jgi:hypothetical protein
MIRKGTEEEMAETKAMINSWNETYAVNMLQLQEKAGLTYKEARAFLIPYRENVLSMSEGIAVSVHAIYNLQRKAKRKIDATGLTLEEIFGDYMPEDQWPVLTSPYE